jgi:hypothetical protein
MNCYQLFKHINGNFEIISNFYANFEDFYLYTVFLYININNFI